MGIGRLIIAAALALSLAVVAASTGHTRTGYRVVPTWPAQASTPLITRESVMPQVVYLSELQQSETCTPYFSLP